MQQNRVAFDQGQFLSAYISDTSERRFISLKPDGVPDVLAIVHSRFDHFKTSPGPHTHAACYELGVCLRGALTLLNNGRECRLLPGDLFINRPRDIHCLCDCPPGTKIYCMIFRSPNRGDRLLRFTPSETTALRAALNRLDCHVVTNATGVSDAFRRLFDAYDRAVAPFRSFCLSSACADLILAFVKDAATHHKRFVHLSSLQEIVVEMRSHPERPFDRDALSRKARLSPSAFMSQFRLLTGQPPYHFLLACRLEEAKRRLALTNQSVTRISMDLGFCAPQHFSSHFKKFFGISPRDWRAVAAH